MGLGGLWSGRVGGAGIVISDFFLQRIHFLGGGSFLTIFFSFFFFFLGGGRGKGRGEGKCTCMSKCFKWQFDFLRRTPVQNHFEIHAYM